MPRPGARPLGADQLRSHGERGRLSTIQIATRELRPFFTPKGLAAYLSISERTVRDMLSRHRISSYKVEGQRRIDPADVDAYLARHREDAA